MQTVIVHPVTYALRRDAAQPAAPDFMLTGLYHVTVSPARHPDVNALCGAPTDGITRCTHSGSARDEHSRLSLLRMFRAATVGVRVCDECTSLAESYDPWQPCDTCGAEPGERCRPMCIAIDRDETTIATLRDMHHALIGLGFAPTVTPDGYISVQMLGWFWTVERYMDGWRATLTDTDAESDDEPAPSIDLPDADPDALIDAFLAFVQQTVNGDGA